MYAISEDGRLSVRSRMLKLRTTVDDNSGVAFSIGIVLAMLVFIVGAGILFCLWIMMKPREYPFDQGISNSSEMRDIDEKWNDSCSCISNDRETSP